MFFGGFDEFSESPERRYRLDELLIMSTPASSNVLH
jgi:hypothetical protein